jgi:hypothetical protein
MPHRAVNPDNFKADLYKAQPEVSLTSTQVHSESSTLASMLQKELVNMKTSDGKMGSMLIDKRLASVADVQDYAALAKRRDESLICTMLMHRSRFRLRVCLSECLEVLIQFHHSWKL